MEKNDIVGKKHDNSHAKESEDIYNNEDESTLLKEMLGDL